MNRKEVIDALLRQDNVSVVNANPVKKVVIGEPQVNRIPVTITFDKPIKMYKPILDDAGKPTD